MHRDLKLRRLTGRDKGELCRSGFRVAPVKKVEVHAIGQWPRGISVLILSSMTIYTSYSGRATTAEYREVTFMRYRHRRGKI